MTRQTETLRQFLQDAKTLVNEATPLQISGKLTRVNGLVMEAAGLKLPLGAGCKVQSSPNHFAEAEVVGFHGEKVFMMPTDDVFGLAPGSQVTPLEHNPARHVVGRPTDFQSRNAGGGKRLPVGEEMLGRVVDGAGRPLDGLGPIITAQTRPLQAKPYNPLQREPIKRIMDTGVRAINGMLTIGRGQRIGLFAGTGVGKSVLLGMMARYTEADINVVGLIGERGREVKEFIEDILGEEGLARSAVVAAPADAPPLMRMQGAAYATSIAEFFRDQGLHVLLLMDSLTRYAMAQREIALAIGEPPATKGYPPSCFAKLPGLVERSGNGLNGVGSITAFYTVLSEGDDQQDPIADAARAILDGHIVLSRALAEAGHFPAIDIEQSASRVMHNVVARGHLDLARQFRATYSRYQKSRDLVQVGAYMSGSDPLLDEAIRLQPAQQALLQQGMFEAATFEDSIDAMGAVLQQ